MASKQTDYCTMVENCETLLFTLRQKVNELNSFFLEPSQKEKLELEVENLKYNINIKSKFIVMMKGYK